jgi:hypothetical protein
MSRGAFCGSVGYLTIPPFDVRKISSTNFARGHWPDVIDLAPSRIARLALGTLGLKVDDLCIDLPFFGGKRLELGVVMLTAADLVPDVCDLAALPLHGGDGGASMLLRLPLGASEASEPAGGEAPKRRWLVIAARQGLSTAEKFKFS